LVICTAHEILLGWSNQEYDGLGMWHVLKTGELHTQFLWGGRGKETYRKTQA
jgi:hypothetical protein